MVEKIFCKFTPANWIQIALLVFCIIGAYFKFDRRMEKVEEFAVLINRRLELMDNDGTQKSKDDQSKNLALASTQAVVNSSSSRITALETQMGTVNPKLERIDTNVQWLMDWVRLNRK